jgi:hypothetical protein
MPYIVAHEYPELWLLRDTGLKYDPGHAMCAKVEYRYREGANGRAFQCAGMGRLIKANLPKLTSPDFFQYVLKHCVKGHL